MSSDPTPAPPGGPSRSALLRVAVGALTVWAALLVLVPLGLTDRADAETLRRLDLEPGSPGVDVARVITDVGSGGTLAVLLPLLALPLLAWRGAGLRLVLAPVAALAVTSALVNGTKLAVGRDRPAASGRLVETHTMSFPSGHSASAAAGLLTFGLLAVAVVRTTAGRSALVALVAGGVAAVGWTRTALAVHWPADVLGGWALGAAVACFTVLVARQLAARPRRVRRRRAADDGVTEPAGGT